MTMYTKNGGPKFAAIQFDGSFESAKRMIDWVGPQDSYFSTRYRLVCITRDLPPDVDPFSCMLYQDDWAVMTGDTFVKVDPYTFATQYEAVA